MGGNNLDHYLYNFLVYNLRLTVFTPDTGEAEYQILVEPGRSLVANSGVLLCQVLGTKTVGDRNYAVIDGSMTELVRPALYSAYHHVLPCVLTGEDSQLLQYDVVGPVCESSDCLATAVSLPPLHSGESFN